MIRSPLISIWLCIFSTFTNPIFSELKKFSHIKPAPAPICAPPQEPIQPAYASTSRIQICPGRDIYTSGSFTYWQPIQENMDLGIVSNNTGPVFGIFPYGINGNVVNPNFGYKPGFKVGLGVDLDHDDWDTCVQYTWFRGTGTTTTSLVPNTRTVLFPTWSIPIVEVFGEVVTYSFASQTWSLHMDLLDWEIGRSYYMGNKLSFRPFFAARAAWIRQNLDVSYIDERINFAVSNNRSVFISKISHSWAVGPRAGINSNWNIGNGFRLFGNAGGDILFTQYTKLLSEEIPLEGTDAPPHLFSASPAQIPGYTKIVKQKDLNCFRTHLNLELGFGWGSYLANNRWHIDLSAGYEIQVFFDQNMFRHFSNANQLANSQSPNGNLYLHGATGTLRLDF